MEKGARVAGWRCFQGDFIIHGFPRPEGPTPQSDSTELAEVLRRGASLGRVDPRLVYRVKSK
jgi:hypothetical protein